MNNELREAISALTDGEAPEASSSKIIDRLIHDKAARAAWTRYQLISDALRERLPPHLAEDLPGRVRGAIGAEPTYLPATRRPIRVLKPLGGLALAASVAAAAILGVRGLDHAPATQSLVANSIAPGVPSSNRWSIDRPAVEARLNAYLVNHSEYAGHGMRGMLPYARIVGYDASE